MDITRYFVVSAAAAAKSLQSCPTLCDPRERSPTGPPIPGTLQARTLEWVAISFSNAWKWKMKVKPLSRVQLLVTPWTAAHQAPPSMGFSRQEYWSRVPLPSPRKDSLCMPDYKHFKRAEPSIYDIHTWAYIPRNLSFEKTHAPQYSLLSCL